MADTVTPEQVIEALREKWSYPHAYIAELVAEQQLYGAQPLNWLVRVLSHKGPELNFAAPTLPELLQKIKATP